MPPTPFAARLARQTGLQKIGSMPIDRPLLAGLGTLLLLGAATDAFGQANTLQTQNFARWRVQDKCVADATKAFPDHDLISLRKRDGMVDQCLADHKMPPREHLAPPAEAPAIVEPPK
jgi:hypothetical protein